jgi:hypothetical protein
VEPTTSFFRVKEIRAGMEVVYIGRVEGLDQQNKTGQSQLNREEEWESHIQASRK